MGLAEAQYERPIWEVLVGLYAYHGNLLGVGRELGVSRPTLERWLEALGKTAMQLRATAKSNEENAPMAEVRRLSGAQDRTPAEWALLAGLQDRTRDFLMLRGYQPVATPVLEQTELFLRKSGGELAAKMYSFVDPSGRRVSLRPEFTSSVVRAYVQGSLTGRPPLRCQYAGPVFRYEPDETGPSEFLQLGAELIGVGGPQADAEVVALAVQGLRQSGLRGYRLRLGHVSVVNGLLQALQLSERARLFLLGALTELGQGPEAVDSVRQRAVGLGLLRSQGPRELTRLVRRMEAGEAKEMVKGFLGDAVSGPTGQRSSEEVLVRYLRKLREYEDPAQMERGLEFATALAGISGAPGPVLRELASLLREFRLDRPLLRPLEELLEALAPYGLQSAPVTLEMGMARGIAYYTGIVFEIDLPRAGGVSLGGGGRYDGLVKALGGQRDVPALGFAYSLDRVAQALPTSRGGPEQNGGVTLVAGLDSPTAAVAVAEGLRGQGTAAELDLTSKNEVEAMTQARRRGFKRVVMVRSDGTTDERLR
jgi:histidyl-tRNA synthetase